MKQLNLNVQHKVINKKKTKNEVSPSVSARMNHLILIARGHNWLSSYIIDNTSFHVLQLSYQVPPVIRRYGVHQGYIGLFAARVGDRQNFWWGNIFQKCPKMAKIVGGAAKNPSF